jgi:hypothetical protein
MVSEYLLPPTQVLISRSLVHLTATFYQSDWIHPKAPSSDIIIPLSTLSKEQSNVFSAPPVGNVCPNSNNYLGFTQFILST